MQPATVKDVVAVIGWCTEFQTCCSSQNQLLWGPQGRGWGGGGGRGRDNLNLQHVLVLP